MEHTIPVDLGIKWSVGAPTPTVLVDENMCYLVFDLAETDGDAMTGLITWRGCTAVTFGFPGDEVQHGHRLWRGTQTPPPYYGAVVVAESAWIAELAATERTHPGAQEAPFAEQRHFVLLFHDSTFECVATGYEAERRPESPEAVVAALAADRINRAEWIGPSSDIARR